jgi:DNA replication protein DnaC
MAELSAIPLLILDDFGMQKLPLTAAEKLLEIVMRRYERANTLLTSNRPVDELGQTAGRHGGGQLDARPAASSRARFEVPPLAV